MPWAYHSVLSMGEQQGLLEFSFSPLDDASIQAPADDALHVRVCVAYFLPRRFQGGGDSAAAAAGRLAAAGAAGALRERPPPPSGSVRVVYLPGFEAYAASFPGFSTPQRAMWALFRLVRQLRASGEGFAWGVWTVMDYDPPWKLDPRHNEVLVYRRSREADLGEAWEAAAPLVQPA